MKFFRVLTLLLFTCAPSLADKILFIGKQPDHPYGTHMYLHTCQMLSKCVTQNAAVEVVISDGWPKDEGTLSGVKAIVVYATPAAEFLLDGPHRDQVTATLDKGVGLVTLHWASSIFQNNLPRLGPTWLKYTGATWVSNVGLHTGPSPLEQADPQHPICRGWKPYELRDEYYLNPTIQDAKPLVSVTAKEKEVVVGWTHERSDGGRVFGTTLGHFYDNFQRERFRKMIVNGILWAAHLQVPDQGANVQLSDQDLALPPRPNP